MSFENVLWMNGISWISASSTKSLESYERDFAGGGRFQQDA